MGATSNLFRSTYVKILVGTIFVFAGITSGIYVGNALINKTSVVPHSEAMEDSAGEPYVVFGSGDLFPLETYTDISGNEGDFSTLLDGKPTVLLYLSLTCGPCLDMLQFWKLRMENRLRKNVQVFVCIKGGTRDIPPEYEGLLSDMKVIFYDDDLWRQKYHLAFWPTIIGVDESGFVKHVQSGFEKYIDFELVEYFFKDINR